ncbi:glycosyltransferase family 2 protein [Pleurocapsales cyanobacterium LEGE 10410]|nr:glycosyltransferase family 2 protein [Pleurocapsales cyanobacterium LEGE 10410]
MIHVLDVILFFNALLILIPCVFFCIECLAALSSRRFQLDKSSTNYPKTAILIPAHNEAMVIGSTLESLLSQVENPKSIVVVADNCNDQTAAIARQLGVTVIERSNDQQRGKGYALDYGLRFLHENPPEIVILIDADCYVGSQTIERLSEEAVVTDQPVQALYLLEKPPNPTAINLISEFAFKVKNLVRPIGLDRLGLPCLLTGTGMAFPWSVLQDVSLASDNIVEDMQLGIDLAIAGHLPRFCSEAKVIGVFPQQEKLAQTQRKRWEHGHLKTLFNQVPRLFWGALTSRQWKLLGLGLELSIPPVSLMVMLWGISFVVTMLCTILGLSSWLPAILLTIAGASLLMAIASAWTKYGSQEVPASTFLLIPLYLLKKIPLYLGFLLRPQNQWVRTERDSSSLWLNQQNQNRN